MSRIHDALKKAEQERSLLPEEKTLGNNVAVTTAADTRDSTGDASRSGFQPAPRVEQVAVSEVSPSSAPDYLRFGDLQQRCAHPTWNFDPNVNVFANPELSEHGAEQFRTLRSRLYQARTNQALRSLLVTSSVPGEGKTFVAVNLVQAIIRQPDRRALLIDADLRCPRVHAMLGAPSSPGLTDYLRGECDEIAVIQHGPEGNLCMIPGGSEVTNPSELLSNGRLEVLVQRLAPVFDWIVVDSPPCLPVADASILASICDGVLLVVKAGATPSAVAQRSSQELQGRNIVGVVLNAVGEAHLYNSEYYHAYRYGYSSSDSNRDQS
jgi:protein-tyrosine kinase